MHPHLLVRLEAYARYCPTRSTRVHARAADLLEPSVLRHHCREVRAIPYHRCRRACVNCVCRRVLPLLPGLLNLLDLLVPHLGRRPHRLLRLLLHVDTKEVDRSNSEFTWSEVQSSLAHQASFLRHDPSTHQNLENQPLTMEIASDQVGSTVTV